MDDFFPYVVRQISGVGKDQVVVTPIVYYEVLGRA
jgi:hypothetical protein